jgi:hypothetical protein
MSSIVQVPACLITEPMRPSDQVGRRLESNAATETKMTSRPARC